MHWHKGIVTVQICCTCTGALCYGRLAYFGCFDVGLVPSSFFTAGRELSFFTAGGGPAFCFFTAAGGLALNFFNASGGLAFCFFTARGGLAIRQVLFSQLLLLVAGLYRLCCLMLSCLLPVPASPSSLASLGQLLHVVSWALLLIAIVTAVALWLMPHAALLLLKLVAVIALVTRQPRVIIGKTACPVQAVLLSCVCMGRSLLLWLVYIMGMSV